MICGNGSTELIYLIPRALRPLKVLIPCPTFMEYERACTVSGASEVVSLRLQSEHYFDVFPGSLRARHVPEDHHATWRFSVIPTTPPDGSSPGREVSNARSEARKRGCYLVVDEAFADFCPEASVASEVENNPYLIVFRSLTKFYALAGLRIGFAVLHPSVSERMKAHKEPWTVNTLAQHAAMAALADEAFQERSLEAMKEEKSFMEKEL